MIRPFRRSQELPTYQQAMDRGFSHEEAINIISMEGEPEYIWEAFLNATPETQETLDKLRVDMFGRPLGE